MNNNAAIPPNLLAVPNTESNSCYVRHCKKLGLSRHPARFPSDVPEFFVRLLTDPEDMVLDPFAGSCVTGEVANRLGRRWICCDTSEEYLAGAVGRFPERRSRTLFPDAPETKLPASGAYAIHHPSAIRELHRQGGNANMCVLLQKASALEDVTERDMRTLGPKRRKILALVSRWMRAASFRRQVLCAYDNRCAVTRMQLKLVDAAHILPVHAEGASDNVRNGIALSPTYHRAFDDGLIYLDENYVMRINEEREKRLAGIALDGGIGRFKSVLGRAIHLPHDRRQRPDVSMIRRANRCRLISGTRRSC